MKFAVLVTNSDSAGKSSMFMVKCSEKFCLTLHVSFWTPHFSSSKPYFFLMKLPCLLLVAGHKKGPLNSRRGRLVPPGEVGAGHPWRLRGWALGASWLDPFTNVGPPQWCLLVYKPHENYSYRYHKPVREIGVMFTNLAIVWGPHFVHDCAIFGVHVGKYSCMEHLGMVGRMFHIGEWIRMGCD